MGQSIWLQPITRSFPSFSQVVFGRLLLLWSDLRTLLLCHNQMTNPRFFLKLWVLDSCLTRLAFDNLAFSDFHVFVQMLIFALAVFLLLITLGPDILNWAIEGCLLVHCK